MKPFLEKSQVSLLPKYPRDEGVGGILHGQVGDLLTKFSMLLLSRGLSNYNFVVSWILNVAKPGWRKGRKGRGVLDFILYPYKEGTGLALQMIFFEACPRLGSFLPMYTT